MHTHYKVLFHIYMPENTSSDIYIDGATVFQVQRTDAFDFAVAWNANARRGSGAMRRIQKALELLRDEVLPTLQDLQQTCETNGLASRPDAGGALNHIAAVDLAIEVDPDNIDMATIDRLTTLFAPALRVDLEALPPVADIPFDPAVPGLALWNDYVDAIDRAVQDIRAAEADTKVARQLVKQQQQRITNNKAVIASARYDIATSLVALRQLQRMTVRLSDHPVFAAVAALDLRIDPYLSAADLDGLVLPRLTANDLAAARSHAVIRAPP
jgi:hypothetical protein